MIVIEILDIFIPRGRHNNYIKKIYNDNNTLIQDN